MISQTELRIMKELLKDFTKDYTINELAERLSLHYAQMHRTIKPMIKNELLQAEKKGKSIMISLNLAQLNDEYIYACIEIKKEAVKKYKELKIIEKDLEKLPYTQYICIIFGSYAKEKPKKDSDIDLLFVIPNEYSIQKFERSVKNTLLYGKLDINIVTEEGLLEMWKKPGKLNVGNEILKGCIMLKGSECFFALRRNYLG